MSQPTNVSTGKRVQRAWLLALLAAAALAAQPARAGDDESEREHLARIAHEIERLQAQVSAAAQDAPTGQRVKFRYDWLQNDLEMLRWAARGVAMGGAPDEVVFGNGTARLDLEVVMGSATVRRSES